MGGWNKQEYIHIINEQLINGVSYNIQKKKNKVNNYNDMGNVFSKLVDKVNNYRKEREKRKILKIYQEVFCDDEEIMGFVNAEKPYEI